MDREILAYFLQGRHDEAVPGRPGHRAGPVLELVVEHPPQYPATVFSRFGPVRHHPRCCRHVAPGGLTLYRHLLVCPAERQAPLVFTAAPGTAGHTKLHALAAGSNEESSADRR